MIRCCLIGAFLLAIALAGLPQQRPAQKSDAFVFEAAPREITAGESTQLRWSIKGATRITIEEAVETPDGRTMTRVVGTFDGETGAVRVTPAQTTTYLIDCEGSATYSCASLTVKVRVKQGKIHNARR